MKRRLEILPFEVTALEGRFGTRVLPSEDEMRIASIPTAHGTPAVMAWIDPAEKWFLENNPISSGRSAWMDRAEKGYWLRDASSNGGVANSILPGNNINGNASIDFNGTAGILMANADPASFVLPEDEFTLLIVASCTATSYLFGTASGSDSTDSLLYVSNSGRITTRYGSSSGMSHPAVDSANGIPFLATMTFSKANGMSIRRNGKEGVRDNKRTNSRSNVRVKIGRQGTAGSYIASGPFGHAFIIHADMSQLGYVDMLSHLEGYMMRLSGITAE